MSTDALPDTFTDLDGWICRDRGADGIETLGMAFEPPAFSVTDAGSAEWVLEKLAEADADILAVDARLKAVTANLNAKRRRLEGRRDYLLFRFGPSLKEYARSHLTGKERTWRGTHGRVEFRRTQGTNRITDMEAAVAFVQEVAPEFVRVAKSVTVTDALTVLRELEAGAEPVWLESTGAGERVTITTGITSK